MITHKSLSDINWEELQVLIAKRVPEGPHLEFKQTLATKDGRPDRWLVDQGDVGRVAKGDLAKEVVAFANAYGGTVLLGVIEGADSAAERLEPLPAARKLAERLAQTLSDTIDPPLPSLEVRAIEQSTEGEGVVAIRVAASSSPPHGYGEPPQAYIRRGRSSEPMTMRDMQAVFWEGRARRERVEAIRNREREKLDELFILSQGHVPKTHHGMPASSSRGLCVRATAIAQQHLTMAHPISKAANWLRPLDHHFSGDFRPPLGHGVPEGGWRPRAHGIQAKDVGPSVWTITDDGTVSVVGSVKSPEENKFRPQWLAILGAQVLSIAHKLRANSNQPSTPIEVDLELTSGGNCFGVVRDWRAANEPINTHVEIGPYLLGPIVDAEIVCRAIEQQVWAAFGFGSVNEISMDVQTIFAGRPPP